MARRINRRRVRLAGIIVALVGIGPAVELLPGALERETHAADNPRPALESPTAAPLEGTTAAPAAPIVVASTKTWIKYVELAIRILALLLAWLTKPEPKPNPQATRRRCPTSG